MKPLKPYMLKRWKMTWSTSDCRFYTCARPGRTGDSTSKSRPVSDDLVLRWVLALPGPNTAIVSLLGRKPDGTSEFSFYSFYGGFDLPSEHPSRLSFQQWLDRSFESKAIILREHPTCDFRPIPTEILDAVATDVRELISAGRAVVLLDSGGRTRTRMVCSHMGSIEESARLP